MKGCVLNIEGKIFGDRDLEKLLSILDGSVVNKAIIFLNNNDAIYYRRRDDGISVLIVLPRQNIGASKIYEDKVVRTFKMKSRLSSLVETFALAKEIENMNLEDFIKKKMA
jgi:hypothetical protein